jgi:hypothetical protein
MLDTIAEWLLGITSAIPAIFVAEGSVHFMLFRVLAVLILLAAVVYLVAMRPFRPLLMRLAAHLRRLLNTG